MCNETKITRNILISPLFRKGQHIFPLGLKVKSRLKSNDFLQEKELSLSSSASATKRTSTKVSKKVRFEIETEDHDDCIVKSDNIITNSCSQSSPLNTVYPVKPASDMTESEKKDLYWQQTDYKVFKGGAQFVAGEIRKRDMKEEKWKNSYSSSINNIYDISVFLANNSPASEDDVSLLNGIPSQQFALLIHWAKVGHARRGLERWSVEFHAKRRYTARNLVIKSVLEAQQILDEQCKLSFMDTDAEEKKDHTKVPYCSLSEEEKVDILRKVSERCSRLV